MDTTVSLKLPSKNYRRTIEELSVVIPDPALKLKFLKQALNEHQKISAPYKLYPPIAEITFRKRLLDNAENICPGSKKAAKQLIRKGVISAPGIRWRWLSKLYYLLVSAILILFIFRLGTAVFPLVKNFNFGTIINLSPKQAETANTKIIIRKPILYSQHSGNVESPKSSIFKSANYQNGAEQVPWYYKNPILIALISQQTEIPRSGSIFQKPLVSFQHQSDRNHPPISTIKPVKNPNKPELVINYFKNPILSALITQPTQNSKPKPISQKRLLSSQSQNSENNIAVFTIKLPEHQNDLEWPLLDYYKNPILAALTSQQILYFTSKPISRKPLLSSQPLSSPKHILFPTTNPAEKQNDLTLVLDYIKNPILAVLTSQGTLNPPSKTFSQKNLLSSQPQSSRSHLPIPTTIPAEHPNKSIQVSEYLNNPILIALNSQQTKSSKPGRIPSKPLLSSQMPETENHSTSLVVKSAKYPNKTVQVPKYLKEPIWLVEKTADREFYSNRLQIITTYTISNIPREYYRFSRNSDYSPANGKNTDKISGIVYHASESDLYPFMPEMNRSILSYSKRLIKYLLRKKSYHFFIDRFGRVYRLVQEDHAAFHAGKSIWADDDALYLNLNHAFIGICFEGKDFQEINTGKQKKGRLANSKSSLLKPTGISSFNEAQLRSGKELTDWLRVKYNISQQNCVPHALISVNTKRMLIGFHLDLARGFPFDRLGLTDKYQEPLPSMIEFGFRYDKYFEKIFNGNLWRGIGYSEEILQRRARNSGMSFAEYRKILHQRFTRYTEWNQKLVEKKDQLTKTSNKQ